MRGPALREYKTGAKVARLQSKRLFDKFRVTCIPSPFGAGAAILIEGPEDYLEHGHLVRVFPRRPKWFPRKWAGRGSCRLSKATVERAGVVADIFRHIASDVCFHQGFQSAFDAAYLTDLAGEAEFLKSISAQDDLALRTEQVCAQLSHEIPMLTDLPVRAVLKIRDENPESFELYRTTLKGIVKEYVEKKRSTTADEARHIYGDVLRPAIQQLRVEAARQRKIWTRKSMLSVGYALGTVSLYATGALQSQQALALLGGTVAGLLGQLAETPRTQPVTSSNLYFLLRVENEAKKRVREAA